MFLTKEKEVAIERLIKLVARKSWAPLSNTIVLERGTMFACDGVGGFTTDAIPAHIEKKGADAFLYGNMKSMPLKAVNFKYVERSEEIIREVFLHCEESEKLDFTCREIDMVTLFLTDGHILSVPTRVMRDCETLEMALHIVKRRNFFLLYARNCATRFFYIPSSVKL